MEWSADSGSDASSDRGRAPGASAASFLLVRLPQRCCAVTLLCGREARGRAALRGMWPPGARPACVLRLASRSTLPRGCALPSSRREGPPWRLTQPKKKPMPPLQPTPASNAALPACPLALHLLHTGQGGASACWGACSICSSRVEGARAQPAPNRQGSADPPHACVQTHYIALRVCTKLCPQAQRSACALRTSPTSTRTRTRGGRGVGGRGAERAGWSGWRRSQGPTAARWRSGTGCGRCACPLVWCGGWAGCVHAGRAPWCMQAAPATGVHAGGASW